MTEFLLGIGSGLRTELTHNFNVQGTAVQALRRGIFAHKKDQQLEDALNAKGDGTSAFGTQIVGQMVFNSIVVVDANGVEQPPIPGLKLVAVLAELSQTKNIIRTTVQGRDEPITEFISNGTYQLSLTGLLAGNNEGDLVGDPEGASVADIGNFYPEQDVRRLRNLLTAQSTLSLTGTFLLPWDLEFFVVRDYNIPQERGTHDTQIFQINLESDHDPGIDELEIITTDQDLASNGSNASTDEAIRRDEA